MPAPPPLDGGPFISKIVTVGHADAAAAAWTAPHAGSDSDGGTGRTYRATSSVSATAASSSPGSQPLPQSRRVKRFSPPSSSSGTPHPTALPRTPVGDSEEDADPLAAAADAVATRRWADAVALFASVASPPPAALHHAVMTAFSDAVPAPRAGLSLLTQLEAATAPAPPRRSAYVAAVRALAAVGRVTSAAAVLARMRPLPDERLVSVVANAAVRSAGGSNRGKAAAGVEAYATALGVVRAADARGVQIGLWCYTVLLQGAGRSGAGGASEVWRLVREAAGRGVVLDTVGRNVLVDALVRTGDVDGALSAFELVAEAVAGAEGGSQAGVVDDVTRNSLVGAVVRAGGWRRARQLLAAGVEGVNTRAAEGPSATDADDAAAPVEASIPPGFGRWTSVDAAVVAYTCLATGLASAGAYAAAVEVLTLTMSSAGVPPTNRSFTAVISACLPRIPPPPLVSSGGATTSSAAAAATVSMADPPPSRGVSTALQLYAMMMAPGSATPPTYITVAALVTGLARAGALSAATAVLASPPPGVIPPTSAFNALIDGLVRRGLIAEAEAAVAAAVARGGPLAPTSVTYTSLIHGYGRLGGGVADAQRLLTAMRAAGIAPDRGVLNAFVGVAAYAGEIALAEAVVSEMEAAADGATATIDGSSSPLSQGLALSPTVIPDGRTYAPLLSAALRREDLSSAWTVYARARERGAVLSAISVINLLRALLVSAGVSGSSGARPSGGVGGSGSDRRSATPPPTTPRSVVRPGGGLLPPRPMQRADGRGGAAAASAATDADERVLVAGRAAALWRDMQGLGYADNPNAAVWGRAVRDLCATVSEAWKGVARSAEGGWVTGDRDCDATARRGGAARQADAAADDARVPRARNWRARGRGRGGVDGDEEAWRRTASGRIFEKHGWNAIDSRWSAF
ncbi:hypothetical protein MMPV_005104 [Pyropia vietnamensis]